jgi:hypothetical protein
MSTQDTGPEIALLRHTVATLAYRAGKVLHNTPPRFAEFRSAEGTRTPAEILAHMCDLFDWAVSLARGEHVWHDSPAPEWDEGVARFYSALAAFDGVLASRRLLGCTPGQLFQGPVADALTHLGQIALLRRMAGAPVRGENYFRADITAGRVGPRQAPPRREFD